MCDIRNKFTRNYLGANSTNISGECCCDGLLKCHKDRLKIIHRILINDTNFVCRYARCIYVNQLITGRIQIKVLTTLPFFFL